MKETFTFLKENKHPFQNLFSILKNATTHLSVSGWEGIRLPNDGRSKESGFLSILRHA